MEEVTLRHQTNTYILLLPVLQMTCFGIIGSMKKFLCIVVS